MFFGRDGGGVSIEAFEPEGKDGGVRAAANGECEEGTDDELRNNGPRQAKAKAAPFAIRRPDLPRGVQGPGKGWPASPGNNAGPGMDSAPMADLFSPSAGSCVSEGEAVGRGAASGASSDMRPGMVPQSQAQGTNDEGTQSDDVVPPGSADRSSAADGDSGSSSFAQAAVLMHGIAAHKGRRSGSVGDDSGVSGRGGDGGENPESRAGSVTSIAGRGSRRGSVAELRPTSSGGTRTRRSARVCVPSSASSGGITVGGADGHGYKARMRKTEAEVPVGATAAKEEPRSASVGRRRSKRQAATDARMKMLV